MKHAIKNATKKDKLNQIVDARVWDPLASNIPENGFCCVTIVRRSMFCISFYEILNKPKKKTYDMAEVLVSKLSGLRDLVVDLSGLAERAV